MPDKIVRKMFLGFINIHILHHASHEPIYGVWLIDELNRHGYAMSAGTLYPILHSMQKDGLLSSTEQLVDGKIRKYYRTTERGREILAVARQRGRELFQEISEPCADPLTPAANPGKGYGADVRPRPDSGSGSGSAPDHGSGTLPDSGSGAAPD